MSPTETWPQPVKLVLNDVLDHTILISMLCRDWVARCLGQMTDSNREEAQKELRQVIADAYTNKTLWTTDWAGMQLQRCVEPSLLCHRRGLLTLTHFAASQSVTQANKCLCVHETEKVRSNVQSSILHVPCRSSC